MNVFTDMHREVKHRQNTVIAEKLSPVKRVFDLATKLLIVPLQFE